jgi:hypothetical protein
MDVYKEWLGIPEGPRPPDHYTLLRCVQFEDNPDKIRANYRKLNAHVRKYATGQYSTQSQELLNELARAMLCLTDVELKRDYDRSLGRDFSADDDAKGQRSLGEILRDADKITTEQLREAESFAEARGLEMRDAVVQLRLVSADVAGAAFAQEHGMSFVDLNDMIPDETVLDQFPRNLVRRHSVLPLFVEGDRLLVACAHPPTAALEDEVRLRTGQSMRPVIATPLAINQGLTKYYAPGMREQVAGKADKGAGAKSTGAKGAGKTVKADEAPTDGRARWNDLSEGEKHHRKMVGLIIMCWATVGSAIIDQLVVKPLLVPKWGWVFAVTLIVPPAAILWVKNSYWK